MRNQEVVLRKLERIQAELKNLEYLLSRNKREDSFSKVESIKEMVSGTYTLASKSQ